MVKLIYLLMCGKCGHQQIYKPRSKITEKSHTTCGHCNKEIYPKKLKSKYRKNLTKEEYEKIIKNKELKEKIINSDDPYETACIEGSCKPFIIELKEKIETYNKLSEEKINIDNIVEIGKNMVVIFNLINLNPLTKIKIAVAMFLTTNIEKNIIIQYCNTSSVSVSKYFKFLVKYDKNKITFKYFDKRQKDMRGQKVKLKPHLYEICDFCYHLNINTSLCEVCGEVILPKKIQGFWKEGYFTAIINGIQQISKIYNITKNELEVTLIGLVNKLKGAVNQYFGGWEKMKLLINDNYEWKKEVDFSLLENYSRFPEIVLGKNKPSEIL